MMIKGINKVKKPVEEVKGPSQEELLTEIRDLLKEHNATHIQIIPKIENQEGIDNIDEILAFI